MTARHELQPLRFTPPPIRRLRMPLDPAGLPIVRAREVDTPRPRRCLPWDGPNVTTFDAPVARRVRRSAARPARTAFTVASSKAPARATQDAFHRRVPRSTNPACAKRSRTRDPPPIPGLCRPGPASGAPSPLAPGGGGARPGRFRALFTPGRTWPRAARRLLQSNRSASTTVGPSKPRTRIGPFGFRRAPYLESGSRSGMRYRANGTVPPGESRGFTGQGPLVSSGSAFARPAPAPSRLDCS